MPLGQIVEAQVPGDADWTGSVRYHALINTLNTNLNVPADVEDDFDEPASNHLITLELFNGAGERVRPLGSASTNRRDPGDVTLRYQGTAAFSARSVRTGRTYTCAARGANVSVNPMTSSGCSGPGCLPDPDSNNHSATSRARHQGKNASSASAKFRYMNWVEPSNS